jgi:phage terminase large subunit-like protein
MVWNRQAAPYEDDDFIGEECMIGLDLASKIDLAAAVKIFRRPNDSEVSSRHPYKYFIIPRLYLPEGAIRTRRNANYEGWGLGGHLIVTPGEAMDFEYIEDDLREDCKKYSVLDIPFDPWQAMQLAQRMTTEGLPMVEFPATVHNFSEPMKEFEALIRQGLIFHNNNPCFNWMISNLTAREDRKGNIFPRKEREENKIDGPVATIMALARWVLRVQVAAVKSVYNDLNDKVIL